jgi:signal transduction histidine kinase
VTPAAAAAESPRERQQLVSELFHALSQPITALRCSLELALHTATPTQASLETALAFAEQIAQLATGIRELIQADDPGDQRTVIALESCLRETLVDMEPLAEAGEVRLELHCDAICRVLSEPLRLRQGLFYLVEFAVTSAAAQSSLEVQVQEAAGAVTAEFTVHRNSLASASGGTAEEETKSQALSRRLGLAIAGRIFESSGGRLQIQEEKSVLRLRLTLPLAG